MEWTQKICEEIFINKYCLNDEESFDFVVLNIAKEISSKEKDKNKWERKFYDIMKEGHFIPAGRILANARPDSKIKNYNNCFTIDIEDSMESIYSSLTEDALISKVGGGVGFDISKLRPKGSKLSRGGISSGPVSFLKIFDASAKTVITGGFRRSAHIALLDVSHPDIEEFITCKQGDLNRELTQFNISVKISEAFMNSVKNNSDWDLVFNGKVFKTVKAKYLFDLLTQNAFIHNEPGIFFVDTVNKYNNGYYGFRIDTCNPCFTGDTIVAVADGRNGVSIKQLSEESNGKKVFPVYSGSNKKDGKKISNCKIEIKNAVAFKSGVKEIITVLLSDGSLFKCTPEHEIYTKDGRKIEAQYSEGEYLEKFYSFSDNGIVVNKVIWTGESEDVYDLTVEDNHNFYIITKTDDDNFMNSSGVLVSNCGEICMPSYNLCCLGSINLSKFVLYPFEDSCEFDFQTFQNVIQTSVRFLDNVLDVCDYPLQKIEKNSLNWRRIGLGFTGLADTFAMMKIIYGSEESKKFSELIAKSLRDYSYLSSIELSKEKGSFPKFDEKILNSNFIQQLDQNIQKDIKNYGLRNIGLNTCAPTGTISFSVGQNCSSGIEPIFALEYTRKIRQDNVETKKEEKVFDYAYLLWSKLNKDNKTIPDYFVTTKDVKAKDSIDVQSIFQKYIDHSISKTLNLQEHSSYDEYSELFFYAHEKELKGFTTFNPNGSMEGILQYTKKESIVEHNAPKRPQLLPCDVHRITANGKKYLVFIGLLDNKPYEVFSGVIDNVNLSKYIEHGAIVKEKKGLYSFQYEDEILIKDIKKTFESDENEALARLISTALRHGAKIQFIIDQLQKSKGSVADFSKSIIRSLKKYIADGTVIKQECSICSSQLVFKEGCYSCPECGWSKC